MPVLSETKSYILEIKLYMYIFMNVRSIHKFSMNLGYHFGTINLKYWYSATKHNAIWPKTSFWSFSITRKKCPRLEKDIQIGISVWKNINSNHNGCKYHINPQIHDYEMHDKKLYLTLWVKIERTASESVCSYSSPTFRATSNCTVLNLNLLFRVNDFLFSPATHT